VLQILTPLRGQAISQESVALMARVLYPNVVSARGMVEALADEFFASQNDGERINAPIRDYPVEALISGLTESLKPQASREPVLDNKNLSKVVGTVHKHAEDAGRRKTIALVREKKIRWARIDPDPPTCYFCITLISRGPVYATAKSAGENNTWHNNCSCKVVPVFNTNDWVGKNQFLAANRLYIKATKKYSSETNLLNSVRRYINDEENSIVVPQAA
jgi:hypothetical protein